MSVINDKLISLSKSKFRSSFHLPKEMIDYINKKGLDKIREDAYYFINNRLSDITKVNDGHQTPMRGHPVFIAEHATATCCRGCLYKWHHIPKDRLLTNHEKDFIVTLIMEWIKNEYQKKE